MNKIILSAFTDEYSRNLDTQITLCRKYQLSCMEPRFINEKNISELSPAEVWELKKKLEGIAVSAIGSPLGKINLNDSFEDHLETAKRVYETANILGTSNVRMFSFYFPQNKSRSECRSEVIDKLGRMIDLAKEYRIVLCHENEADIYGESPEMCLDLAEVFRGDLKCVFDMGNFVLGGYNVSDAYAKLKGHIQYFHIKDALSVGAIVPPGCGEGMIAEILKDYTQSAKQDVFLTLEPHLQTFDGLNALTNRSFENPYQYDSPQTAFLDALTRIRKIITGLKQEGN